MNALLEIPKEFFKDSIIKLVVSRAEVTQMRLISCKHLQIIGQIGFRIKD